MLDTPTRSWQAEYAEDHDWTLVAKRMCRGLHGQIDVGEQELHVMADFQGLAIEALRHLPKCRRLLASGGQLA